MTDLESALALIAAPPETASFEGPRPKMLVRAAERALGFPLPPTYRRFCAELGAGNIGIGRMPGVIDADFERSSVPDAIWATLRAREDGDLPLNIVVLGDEDGELTCPASARGGGGGPGGAPLRGGGRGQARHGACRPRFRGLPVSPGWRRRWRWSMDRKNTASVSAAARRATCWSLAAPTSPASAFACRSATLRGTSWRSSRPTPEPGAVALGLPRGWGHSGRSEGLRWTPGRGRVGAARRGPLPAARWRWCASSITLSRR